MGPPEVENAYRLSGRAGLRAAFFMLAFGLLVGSGVGAFLYLLHYLVAGLGLVLLLTKIPLLVLFALVFVPVGKIVAAGLVGYAVALAVARGARTGKCRSEKSAQAIGVVSSIVSYCAFLVVYSSILRDRAFNSMIDVVMLVGYFLAMTIVGGIYAGREIRRNERRPDLMEVI